MNHKSPKPSASSRKRQNKNNKKITPKRQKKPVQTTAKRNIAHAAPQSTSRNVLNLFAAAGGGKKQQNVEAIHSPLEFAMYAPTVGAQVGGFEHEYASRYRSAADHLSHTSYVMRDGMANNTNNFVQAMGSWMSHMDWKFNNANKHLLQLRGEYLPTVHFEGLARSQEKEERDEEQYRQRKQERRFQKMLQQTQNHQRSQHNARHMQQSQQQQQSILQKPHKAQSMSPIVQKSPVKVMEQQLPQQRPKRAQATQQHQPQEQQQQHKQTTEIVSDELKAQTSKNTPSQQATPSEARAPLGAKKPFVSPQIQQFINQAQQPQQKKQPHNAEQLKPMPTPEFLDEKKNVDIETTKMYLAMPLDDQTVAQNKKNEKIRNKAKTATKNTTNKQSKMTVDAAGVVVDGTDGKLNELDVIDPSHRLVAANGGDEEEKDELNTIIRGVDAKNHATSQSK